MLQGINELIHFSVYWVKTDISKQPIQMRHFGDLSEMLLSNIFMNASSVSFKVKLFKTYNFYRFPWQVFYLERRLLHHDINLSHCPQ